MHILNTDINKRHWDMIHKICFKTLKRNDFIWFQFRIIHRILGTRAYLNQIHISNNSTCVFCEISAETICHTFTSCPVVMQFWNNVKLWLQQFFNMYLDLNPKIIIFGLFEKEVYFFPKNVIIIVSKRYIFTCSRNSKLLDLFGFQNFLRSENIDQEYIANTNNQFEQFLATWSVLEKIKGS